ncbi:MAG: hypothetical protein HAW66_05850 [Shewanella sp.]|nr:hypothetical protein [Shewanella sp.]
MSLIIDLGDLKCKAIIMVIASSVQLLAESKRWLDTDLAQLKQTAERQESIRKIVNEENIKYF